MKLIKNILAASAMLFAGFSTSQTALAGFGLGINAGMEVAPLVTTGADAFYDMGQFTFGLHYAQGSGDLTDLADISASSVTVDKLEAETTIMSFDARMFLLFGFNVFVGLGQRTLDFDYAFSESGVTVAGDITTKSQITRVGLGTMGRFGVFYVGLDLAAMHMANSGSADLTANVTGVPSALLANEVDKFAKTAEDDIAKGQTLGVAIFSIGALL